MEDKDLKKYIFIALTIIIGVISYFIVKNFIIPAIGASILTYLFFPVYKKLAKRLKKGIASGLTILLIVVIILVPLFLLINSIVLETSNLLTQDKITAASDYVSRLLRDNPQIKEHLPAIIEKMGTWIFDNLLSFVLYIPQILIGFFIILFICFYLFIDGERIVSKIKDIIPFKNKQELINYVSGTSHNMIYGLGIVAVIELIVCAIGFKIAGLSLWLVLAFMIAIAVFIPFIGPMMVWIPTCLILILQKNWYAAIVVLITGLIVSYLLDTILYFKILNKRTKIHPIILLMGVIGGVSTLGIVGLIAGPIILGVLIKLLESSVDK